jgi:O-acetyl-ADP-ribose deacetylase (regulator of RNase III)
MKEVQGDLLELAKQGNFDIIVHGANCMCTMGSGIAKQIKEQFPEAYNADLETRKGDFRKLGNYTLALIRKYSFIIINAYTQYDYGTDSPKIDYEALTLCLRKINKACIGKRIGLPLIGAGLAGGDWNRIENIIKTELNDVDVTIVYYNKLKIG